MSGPCFSYSGFRGLILNDETIKQTYVAPFLQVTAKLVLAPEDLQTFARIQALKICTSALSMYRYTKSINGLKDAYRNYRHTICVLKSPRLDINDMSHIKSYDPCKLLTCPGPSFCANSPSSLCDAGLL